MARTLRLGRVLAVLALGAALAACGGQAAVGPSNRISVADIAKVQRGMSRDEVQRVLGAPTLESEMGRGRGTVWTYNYIDRSQATPHMQLFVWFDAATGKVTRTESGFNPAFDPSGN
jgi:outer membrane protein assembly factor BamE (lipoprotein component of BamABCDE complex)